MHVRKRGTVFRRWHACGAPRGSLFHRNLHFIVCKLGVTREGPVEQKEDVDIAGDTRQEEVDLKEEREQRAQQKEGKGEE